MIGDVRQSGTAGQAGRSGTAGPSGSDTGDVVDLRERIAPYGATAIPLGDPTGPTLTSLLAAAATPPAITLVDSVTVTQVPHRHEGHVVWEPAGR